MYKVFTLGFSFVNKDFFVGFIYIEPFAGLVVKNYSKTVLNLEYEIVLSWSAKGDLTATLKMSLSR